MYVAINKSVVKGKVYKSYLIRTSYREGDKVKHKTLSNISHLPEDLIEVIRLRLKSGRPVTTNGFSIKRSLPHGHVAIILHTIRQLGLDKMISSKNSPERNIITGLIAQRLIQPLSKLATSRTFRDETATNTLGTELGLANIEQDDIYRALDWLLAQQPSIEKKLAKKHLNENTIILYDISGSYYTGKKSDLVQFGYNRDRKKGFPQIVYGLICSEEGIPVAIEVFSGNTSDSSTLSSQISKVREKFGIRRVVWVGDRGMITSKIIDEQLKDDEGIDWITALRSAQVKKLVHQEAIQLSLFDKQDMAEIESEDYPGERLVVCKNPFLAEERKRKRKELLQETCHRLDKVVKATRRQSRPLRGEDKIGVAVGKVISKFKMEKHIRYTIDKDSFTYHVDQESVEQEKALDGIYVLRTSLSQKAYSSEKTVETYKSLSKVEWAFRSIKTTSLLIRPVFHYNDDRIRSHVFLCMLAYYVEWHLKKQLAHLLYVDHNKEDAKKKRTSPVEPAQKSDDALAKSRTHKTKDGDTVQSMKTIFAYMATICKNQIQYENSEETFFTITEPNKQQRDVLNALNMTL